MPAPNDVPRAHLRFLDGLRAFAALAVVWHHAYLQSLPDGRVFTQLPALSRVFMWGKFGVPIFIAVSGFILALQMAERRVPFSSASRIAFLKRRAHRILPPYYAALGISALLCLAFTAELGGVSARGLLTHLLLVQNVDTTVYDIDGPLWSVATEVQIYVVFAFVLSVVWLRYGIRLVVPLTVALGIAVHFAVPQVDRGHLWLIGAFAIGMGTADLASRERSASVDRLVRSVGMLAFVAAAVLFLVDKPQADSYDWLIEPLVALATGAAILSLLAQQERGTSSWGLRALTWPVSQRVGITAYSIYLVHLPVLVLVMAAIQRLHASSGVSLVMCLAVAVPIALGASLAFYHAVESHFLNSHQREAQKQLA